MGKFFSIIMFLVAAHQVASLSLAGHAPTLLLEGHLPAKKFAVMVSR
jgi:hypothetical protein